MWTQWLYYVPLRARAFVCLNIDETPVYRQMQPRQGYVVRTQKQHDPNCYARIPVRDRRGQCSMLAVITNVPDLQAHLPQFLLCNDKTLSVAEKNQLRVLPSPLRWVVGTAGWVTPVILKVLLTDLRRAVRARLPDDEIVIFMDCATVHTCQDVLMHCSRLNLHVVFLPGSMTHLCQPLDTHVFAGFKRTLSELQENARSRDPLGIMRPGVWIDPLINSVQQELVEKDWSKSFTDNGLLGDVSSMRPTLLDLLSPHLPVPLRLPVQEELDLLLGSKRLRLVDFAFRAGQRLAARRVPLAPPCLRRLPRGPAAAGVFPAGRGSSAGPSALPPLPPPADPPDLGEDTPRSTRSGARY